jgi:hypothetical protein
MQKNNSYKTKIHPKKLQILIRQNTKYFLQNKIHPKISECSDKIQKYLAEKNDSYKAKVISYKTEIYRKKSQIPITKYLLRNKK